MQAEKMVTIPLSHINKMLAVLGKFPANDVFPIIVETQQVVFAATQVAKTEPKEEK